MISTSQNIGDFYQGGIVFYIDKSGKLDISELEFYYGKNNYMDIADVPTVFNEEKEYVTL